ncbi:siderophore ABC transporter substrate-binding protein [Microbacterium amylolyticum]|uniref:Iron complex transport system substrate-binding protein n=1 Tax=Microbacterium amylolyticum TaxID=936337 RepID=A0ABS4ZGC5_9MICO|nr:siderophore ABC transporter substrate-binding protein [Microbacterium amylolyticum]MBP2436329.1 iron complex transport system substrate-binding protein [Microbacterium amylolyticum]
MPTIRPLSALSLIAASTLVLAGCSSSAADGDASAESGAAGDATQTEETVSFTFDAAVGDPDDPDFEEKTVEVPKNPENVVIFDMASLDTWGNLGGEAAGAPLDSVPDYLSDYLVDDAINAGTLFEADLLAIEAIQPDLIIIAGRSSTQYEALTQITPNVIDLTANGPFEDQLERSVTLFGEILGQEDAAAEALAELQGGIAEAREATEGIGTGLAIMTAGDSITALAPSSGDFSGPVLRGGLVYDVFGVEPVHADIRSATHGEPVSFEFLLEQDPDYLFVLDRNAVAGSDGDAMADVVLDNEIVHQTTAWKNDQIVSLDPAAWYIVFGGIETTQIMIDDILSITS